MFEHVQGGLDAISKISDMPEVFLLKAESDLTGERIEWG